MHEHAEDTNLLDLRIWEDELLNNIKKKDRYYINRAIKEKVEIRIDNELDHIKKLIEMHQKHANRMNWKKTYSAFSPEFIKNIYKVFWNNISTISASYKWNTESILMTIRFWKICVYYIAASDIISHKFSPNYLCQWEAIKKAKRDWCTIYNFWWVSPDDNPKHPIAWVSQFKRKFGWYDYSLLHTQDLVLSPIYYINWIVETFRRIKRGYYYKKPE
jgi:lipid II:glycine glycyltransferase (peptidoglycan interpeptide bridge formation enzyme)